MRNVMTAAAAMAIALAAAAPLVAQERGTSDPNAYVTASGGFASAGRTTGDLLFEGGVRVAPHVMLFADVGQFHNLQADLQPTLDQTTNAAASEGATLVGSGSLPAWYTLGGVRVNIPVTTNRMLPYALGGLGVARLNPSAQFAFSGGALPDGSTPEVGSDVTPSITGAGLYTQPGASSAFMYTLGGGVQVPVASHWMADVGYRYSRIAADSTLSAGPLNAQGMTFGVGYRF
jgi:opacity protein-like surface antigen